MPTNYEAMVTQGCAEAAKATTALGEYAAWVAVVAQHIPLDERPQRLPQWVRDSQAMNRAKRGLIDGTGADQTGITREALPASGYSDVRK